MGFLQTLLPRVSRADNDAKLSEAVTRAEAAEARLERVEEYLRVIANSPMLGMPSPGVQPPPGLGAYAFDRPLTFAVPQSPNRKPLSLVSVDTLRILADTYDIGRSCTQHLKREVAAVPIKFVSREEDDASDKTQKRIQEAGRFFTTAGGLGGAGRRRSQFENAWIDDLLTIGALCFYYRQTRGGGVYEVEIIDAATIRPKVDAFGWPGPGEKVYQQWVYGVMTAEYDRTEMVYDGIHANSYTPYFKSPWEWILAPVMSHMKADEWNRVWLTDGTTPSDMVALPEQWTPEQARTFTQWFEDVYAGDSKARNRTKFVPAGTSRLGNPTRKDQDFQQYEHWLMLRCCSIFGVQPASIGYSEKQYKVSQEQSMDQTSEFGAGEILEVRKARYDDILERLGYPDLECVNVTSQEEAADDRATRVTTLVSGGVMTPNEARAAEGLDSIEGGEELFISTTLQPIALAINPPEPPTSAPGESASGASNPASKTSTSRAAEADPLNTDPRLSALALWQKKAINRVKAGKSALCQFEHNALDERIVEAVTTCLGVADSAGTVRGSFGNAILDIYGRETFDRWADAVCEWPTTQAKLTEKAQILRALDANSPVPPLVAPPTPDLLPITKQELGARWQRRREEHEATFGKPE
jgi:phage portal protein BeeE